uniref:Uncharacterized protein n=1 Tax=Hyaloperonospora arabidopsidis (strain Emoy2) TaxID=559515 RepID=M4BC68_HYAAE
MEDTLDSGKRTQVGSNAVGLYDNHEDFDDEDGYSGGNTSDHDMGGQSSVTVTTPQQSVAPQPLSERPQWQQPNNFRQQPLRSQMKPTIKYQPGSKRHSRTHSLEALSEPPVDKRYGRSGHTGGTHSTAAPGPRSSFHDMSAHLASTQDEDVEEECARVVYSVGDLLISFKSAMESNNADKWKKHATPSSSR